ncbi:MAG: adenine deaminase C-terminal domain-containing protein [Bacillota bacterium]
MQVDLLVKDVYIYNSAFKSFIHGDAAIIADKFYHIGKDTMNQLEAKEVVAGQKRYMVPGLIDIHLHIESSMVTPKAFSHELIRNGVTTVVTDPHEIANVFGVEGIKAMIAAGGECQADIFYGIPSSVPSTNLETSGAVIDMPEIEELLKEEKVVCLGEVMNYMEVINEPHGKTNQILRYIKQNYPLLTIEGHCPMLMDLDLSRYIFAGVDSDHTHQTAAGLQARIAMGMFVEIQEKSMTTEVMDYLQEAPVKEHFCFVTDDVMPDSFMEKGHLNYLIKKAMKMGMEPEQAIYAATYTPAKRMKLLDRGSIAPNKLADFILLNNLDTFAIDEVYKSGKKVYAAGEKYTPAHGKKEFPEKFYQSVQREIIISKDLEIHAPVKDGSCQCRVMMVSDGSTFTKEKIAPVPTANYLLEWEKSPYCLAGVFERYGKNGNIGLGLVGGEIIQRGAIATTYAHDHHNLLVVGKSQEDFLIAANEVIKNQGGYCVVENGKVLAFAALPIGGILSEKYLEDLSKEIVYLKSMMISLGYKHYNPIMSFSTLGLPVSPELKITDKGLVKVTEGKLVNLFI